MRILLSFLIVCASRLQGLAADPFKVEFRQELKGSNIQVYVAVTVPWNHHIYADQVEARLDGGAALVQIAGDRPVTMHDALTGSDRAAFSRDFMLVYAVGIPPPRKTVVKFSYQGCNEQECFFPKTIAYTLTDPGLQAASTSENPRGGSGRVSGWIDTGRSHGITARASGYMRASDFLDFLRRAEGEAGTSAAREASLWDRIKAGFLLFGANPVEFMNQHGVWWTFVVILIGGLLLNLTPCVLPMIPINLAILGVGAQNSTRARGLLLGACYGLGIALVYGALGLVVVLTGSQFGALNSMPWFNAGIGIVFVVLALAMFDVFAIDFTRFQSVGDGSQGRGSLVTALVMGGVAALLAGACVAPVVIAVLLLSGNLYAHGASVGLALPFILGLGMALPWPLAGAGLSFLPKPGSWMRWIKYGFGVFILIFALYYFSLAYRGWRGGQTSHQPRAGAAEITSSDAERWAEILEQSTSSGKPVFVDFWATWCKNCEAMELTTFRDAEVQKKLAGYEVVKLQAEKPADPDTAAVLGYFEVKGLPTYLVLKPVPGRSKSHEK